jgi:hypothetical protein
MDSVIYPIFKVCGPDLEENSVGKVSPYLCLHECDLKIIFFLCVTNVSYLAENTMLIIKMRIVLRKKKEFREELRRPHFLLHKLSVLQTLHS